MPQLPFTFRAAVRPAEADAPPRERAEPAPSEAASEAAPAPPPFRPEPRRLSVTELNVALRKELESGFRSVWVEGEVRRPKVQASSGHAYFELADARSVVPVFLARSVVRKLDFPLKDGLHVLIEGVVSLFEPRGQLQLRGRRLEPVGEGALRLALEARAQKLREEGLTDAERKKPVPPFPRPIGIVTSRSGAALRDVVRTALRRDPRAHLILAAASVQGHLAPGEIVRALRRLDRAGCGVILLVRGGGSLEDLRPFNEEPVARAVAACSTPVVTGVGHETDTTLVDLVADRRASTPTAAAELVVPRRRDVERARVELEARLHRALGARLARAERDLGRVEARLPSPARRLHGAGQSLDALETRGQEAVRARLDAGRRSLERLERSLAERRPEARLQGWRLRLEHLESRLEPAVRRNLRAAGAGLEQRALGLGPGLRRCLRAARTALEREEGRLGPAVTAHRAAARGRLELYAGRLHGLSPLAVLARGYAVATGPEGRALRRASDVGPGERLGLRLAEGTLEAVVTSTSARASPDDEDR